jgi:hypothetical protein
VPLRSVQIHVRPLRLVELGAAHRRRQQDADGLRPNVRFSGRIAFGAGTDRRQRGARRYISTMSY